MVALPMFADQPQNAKWIEEKSLGRWIKGTKLSGGRLVPAREITDALNEVLNSLQIKDTVVKWSRLARGALEDGGSSQRDFLSFVSFS